MHACMHALLSRNPALTRSLSASHLFGMPERPSQTRPKQKQQQQQGEEENVVLSCFMAHSGCTLLAKTVTIMSGSRYQVHFLSLLPY